MVTLCPTMQHWKKSGITKPIITDQINQIIDQIKKQISAHSLAEDNRVNGKMQKREGENSNRKLPQTALELRIYDIVTSSKTYTNSIKNRKPVQALANKRGINI